MRSGDHAGDQVEHLARERAESDEVFGRQPHAKAANRQHRTRERKRRDDGVDAAPVGQAGVNHRRHFVDAPADAGRHALDNHHQVRIVGEDNVALLQEAVALEVNLARPIDENVADRRIVHRAFERPESERLVHDFVDEPLALHLVHHFGRVERELDGKIAHVAAEPVRLDLVDAGQVEAFDELAVNLRFELLKLQFQRIADELVVIRRGAKHE
jgi:hypothetical protein